MRDELKHFAMEMEKKLALTDAKYGDSWKSMVIQELLERLRQEWNEFKESVLFDTRGDPEGIPRYDHEELIDIANICMMLYNRASPDSNAPSDGEKAKVSAGSEGN